MRIRKNQKKSKLSDQRKMGQTEKVRQLLKSNSMITTSADSDSDRKSEAQRCLYKQNHMENVRTQWHFDYWESLAEID